MTKRTNQINTKATEVVKLLWLLCFVMAAGLGFEPRQTESESVVLPLHNPATIELTDFPPAEKILS